MVKWALLLLCYSSVAVQPQESGSPEPLWEKRLCGLTRSQPRLIINGLRVREGLFPWVVFLQVRFVQPKPSWGNCGGTIVTRRHVLTASHCLLYKGSPAERCVVRYGHSVLARTRRQESYVFAMHPRYDDDTLDNDVAVITLPDPLFFTPHVRPACFPNSPVPLTGLTGVIAGWGNVNESSKGHVHPYLLYSTQKFQEQSMCDRKLGGDYYNTSTMLCAYKATYDACQGDSGGGITVLLDNRFYIVGIISFGIGCGDLRYPGAYSNVQVHRDWLLTQIYD